MTPATDDAVTDHHEGPGGVHRTHLANERTYLAWLRSGLTSIAVGIAVAKFIPDLTSTTSNWQYVALGVGFCLFGLILFVIGLLRLRRVGDELGHGRFAPLETLIATIVSVLGVVLALATLLVVVFDR